MHDSEVTLSITIPYIFVGHQRCFSLVPRAFEERAPLKRVQPWDEVRAASYFLFILHRPQKGVGKIRGEKEIITRIPPTFRVSPGSNPHNLLWGGPPHEAVPFSALGVHKTVAISQAEGKNRQGERTSPSQWICHLGSSINWFFTVLFKGVYHKQSESKWDQQ